MATARVGYLAGGSWAILIAGPTVIAGAQLFVGPAKAAIPTIQPVDSTT